MITVIRNGRIVAAAFGGTTAIIDFASQSRGMSMTAAKDAWHARTAGRCGRG